MRIASAGSVPGIDPIPVAQPGGHGNRPWALGSGPVLAAPGLAGPELAGPELAGPELAAPGLAGPELAGPELAAPGLAGSVLKSDTLPSLERRYGSPRRAIPQ
jgi:hypothetical protein